jgi:hypothetical protein
MKKRQGKESHHGGNRGHDPGPQAYLGRLCHHPVRRQAPAALDIPGRFTALFISTPPLSAIQHHLLMTPPPVPMPHSSCPSRPPLPPLSTLVYLPPTVSTVIGTMGLALTPLVHRSHLGTSPGHSQLCRRFLLRINYIPTDTGNQRCLSRARCTRSYILLCFSTWISSVRKQNRPLH